MKARFDAEQWSETISSVPCDLVLQPNNGSGEGAVFAVAHAGDGGLLLCQGMVRISAVLDRPIVIFDALDAKVMTFTLSTDDVVTSVRVRWLQRFGREQAQRG